APTSWSSWETIASSARAAATSAPMSAVSCRWHSEVDLDLFFPSEGKVSLKRRKKYDVKGKSTAGKEHASRKRPSTTAKHQKGRAEKRKSYGGEKGDMRRSYPRKKYKGYKGPWPPPEKRQTAPNKDGENGGLRVE